MDKRIWVSLLLALAGLVLTGSFTGAAPLTQSDAIQLVIETMPPAKPLCEGQPFDISVKVKWVDPTHPVLSGRGMENYENKRSERGELKAFIEDKNGTINPASSTFYPGSDKPIKFKYTAGKRGSVLIKFQANWNPNSVDNYSDIAELGVRVGACKYKVKTQTGARFEIPLGNSSWMMHWQYESEAMMEIEEGKIESRGTVNASQDRFLASLEGGSCSFSITPQGTSSFSINGNIDEEGSLVLDFNYDPVPMSSGMAICHIEDQGDQEIPISAVDSDLRWLNFTGLKFAIAGGEQTVQFPPSPVAGFYNEDALVTVTSMSEDGIVHSVPRLDESILAFRFYR